MKVFIRRFIYLVAIFALQGTNAMLVGFADRSLQCYGDAVIYRPSGELVSHNSFPEGAKIPVNLTCFWLLQAPGDKGFLVQSSLLDLAGPDDEGVCETDFLAFFVPEQGEKRGSNTLTGLNRFTKPLPGSPYCGQLNSTLRILTQSNTLLIALKTGPEAAQKGFKMHFTSLPVAEIIKFESIVDEDNCNSSLEWRCPSEIHSQVQTCIPKKWVCDDIEDCPNKGDEKICRKKSVRYGKSTKVEQTIKKLEKSASAGNASDVSDDWGRVVNGQPAQPGAWPFIVSLRLGAGASHVCGGSLISENYVLTAAHCVYDFQNPSYWKVDLGRYYKDSGADVQRISVSQIFIYPTYDPVKIANDLALMQLAQPATLGLVKKVAVVRQASQAAALSTGTPCLVAGWGDTRNTGSNDVLRQASLPVIDYSLCSSWYSTLTQASFCAGYAQGGIDACQGDSGGPLLCRLGDSIVQAGVVSWGADCAQPRQPGVYTNLAMFNEWYRNIQ